MTLIGVSKAALSQGPPEELYGGTISRTLESGDRSDSRIQYHVVQLALLHRSPRSALSRELFAPYRFSSRGPLAGLISVPLVAAGGAIVLPRLPNEPWALFDDQGFSVFRLTCMVLAAIALLGAFGFVEALAGPRRALLAATLLAGTPFFLHEVYFTWPKLFSSYFALLGLLSVARGRSFLAGCWLGLGYLAHPGALFAVPMAVSLELVWALESSKDRGWMWSLRQGTLYARMGKLFAGVALGVLFWRVINRGQVEQGQFVDYFLMAYGRRAATFHEWLALRVESLSNTLVPFAAYVMTPKPGVPPSGVARFMYQYWLSLPFAVGLTAVPAFLWTLGQAARRYMFLFLSVVIVPLLIFATYWGATDAGMMREGLHAWFCVVVCFAALVWRTRDAVMRLFSGLLLFRLIEVLLMLFWPRVLLHLAGVAGYGVTDGVFTGLICVLASWLVLRTATELSRSGMDPDPSLHARASG